MDARTDTHTLDGIIEIVQNRIALGVSKLASD
jgi:hypothetical protein